MTKRDKQMTKVKYKWNWVSRNEECRKGVEYMGHHQWGGTYFGRVAEECRAEWGCGRAVEKCRGAVEECGGAVEECGGAVEECGGAVEECRTEWECRQVAEECGTECPLTLLLRGSDFSLEECSLGGQKILIHRDILFLIFLTLWRSKVVQQLDSCYNFR